MKTQKIMLTIHQILSWIKWTSKYIYHTVHSLQWGKERAHMMMLLREMVSKDQIAIAIQIYSHTIKYRKNRSSSFSHTFKCVCLSLFWAKKKIVKINSIFVLQERYYIFILCGQCFWNTFFFCPWKHEKTPSIVAHNPLKVFFSVHTAQNGPYSFLNVSNTWYKSLTHLEHNKRIVTYHK